MTRIAYVAVALTLSLAACRGGDDTGDDVASDAKPSADGSGSGSNAGVVTVKQVQDDAMASGTQLELKGVVVLAIDTYGAKTGDLWVGDPEGGAFSGVKVFGAPLTAVATLAPGDLVNIENAQKYEFACYGTICGGGVFDPGMSITEVEGITAGSLVINKVGTGTLPAPAEVDALAISMMADEAARNAEWEKWEGVRIKVINARQMTEVKPFSAMSTADDQKKFTITSGAIVETVLTPFPPTAVIDTCYSSITGIGDYFFDYLVLPTAATDVVDGGTGCAALPVFTSATIPEIQAGTKTGGVVLTDVYVSAIAQNRKNYWISSSLVAAANEGVYVFRCSSTASCMTAPALDASITVGSKISLKATTEEYNNNTDGTTLTQLKFATVTAMAVSAGTPTPVTGKTATELIVEATGEPYESVLVTLSNVKVTTAPTTGSFGVATLTQDGTAFKADDDIYLIAASDTSCYATMTGIWTYSFYNNVYQFLPTAVGVGTGNCL